jgi:hypothetical protein
VKEPFIGNERASRGKAGGTSVRELPGITFPAWELIVMIAAGGSTGWRTYTEVLICKKNLPGRIELLQEIKIKNIAGQHGAAMLPSCGE